MKVPRNLNGRDFAAHCIRHWQYYEVQQVGSHIILQSRMPLQGTLSVPAHKPLRIGTLNTLIRLVTEQRNVPREQVLKGL